MNDSFTLPMLREWLLTAQGSLRDARAEIDALNVFPVPDGDTGTNLYLTWEAACEAIRTSDANLDEGDRIHDRIPDRESESEFESTAYNIGRQAILGARGNSGVIMSALLRDLSSALAREPHAIAKAFRAGMQGAYSAVATPVEGTILTVARACADKAEELAEAGSELGEVITGAADAAYFALLKTPELLEQLRQAGVVDAGGRGLVVVLDSLVASVTGTRPRRELRGLVAPLNLASEITDRPRVAEVANQMRNPEEFEVMYHLKASDLGAIQSILQTIGSSVMIAGVGDFWNIHVHVPTNRISEAINCALTVGVVSNVSVTPLQDQPDSPSGPREPIQMTRLKRKLVVVTHGPGVEQLLLTLGTVTVPTAARQQPSAAELIAAGQRADSPEVVLLPSDRDAHGVADIAASELRSLGLRVAVIPTKSITQSLAAVAVHDIDIEFERDVVNMTRAASATHYGAVTQSIRDVLTMAGECHSGDFLGVIDGEVAIIGNSMLQVASQVLDRMLIPGTELVTIVAGLDCLPSETTQIAQWIKTKNSLLEVETIQGEQPFWPLIFGVE